VCPAHTQQRQIPLVAFLSPRTVQLGFDPTIDAFKQGLRELGYIEGQDIRVELRAAGGDSERLPALAAELVALKPNVIVTHGGPAVRAVKDAAGDIPIVMSVIGDPIAAGFVQSLHRPGGNITGFTNLSTGLLGKRLEMLLEAVPNTSCVAVLSDRANQAINALAWDEIRAAGQALRTELKPIVVSSSDDLETAFAEIGRQGCRAMLALASTAFVGARQQLALLGVQHRIATSYDNRLIVEAGGLMSYGPDTADMHRRAAVYVDKILRGMKAADLPVEQPTEFELAINLRTAKALSLTIGPALLSRADEIIE
jgi:putative ABC transport system substrate-binding protein